MVEKYVEVNVSSECELVGILLIFTGTYNYYGNTHGVDRWGSRNPKAPECYVVVDFLIYSLLEAVR